MIGFRWWCKLYISFKFKHHADLHYGLDRYTITFVVFQPREVSPYLHLVKKRIRSFFQNVCTYFSSCDSLGSFRSHRRNQIADLAFQMENVNRWFTFLLCFLNLLQKVRGKRDSRGKQKTYSRYETSGTERSWVPWRNERKRNLSNIYRDRYSLPFDRFTVVSSLPSPRCVLIIFY